MNNFNSKILLVSWPILPNKGGSCIIVEKLAKQFSRDEMVVLGELPLFGKPGERPPTMPRFHYFRSGFSLFGRGARFFAPLRRMLFPLLVRKITRVARQSNCNVFLGVFPDEVYCHAACRAAEQLGLPFSTYFHNTYIDNEAADQRRGARIQQELFANSDHVFVMSEGMKRFFDEKYQLGKVTPLVHTFDEIPTLPDRTGEPLKSKDKIRLVLFGNFNHSNVEATARFVRAAAKDARYEIHFYTRVPLPMLRMRGIDTAKIHHQGFIDDDRLIDELQKYDIAVLTHGFSGAYGSVEYKTIFPTRTIPMLLAGIPMFVHSPPEAFLTEFVREHNLASLVNEPDENLILDGLAKIRENPEYAATIVRNAQNTARMFYGPLVAKILKTSLRSDNGNYSPADHQMTNSTS